VGLDFDFDFFLNWRGCSVSEKKERKTKNPDSEYGRRIGRG
jgi:hypothetical protein